ncbi:unnamed protein product [Brachionus calyciflorus]|uniref:RING-type E3 ubiquitin transferase n=1 Tax=Brachionus calyciflorus TaxID=104777 RepID=A0A813T9R5_9BILA|nr:unnamed protein product [Brachionus calyciflorus]
MSSNNPEVETSSEPLIGYCHQCDRQVEIDRDNYTCKQCESGFIELFDLERQESQPQNSGNRVESINFYNEGIPNFLPFLLPQLLNQSRGQINQNQPVNSSTTVRQHGPTRLQLFVPGNRLGETTGQEQFDLYGIINNVISDLLDPRRAGGQNTQFHFQSPPIRMFQLHGDMRDYAWGANGLDSIITQLLNQLENTGPPPASEDQLKNLPQIIINQQDVERSAQCAICMEDFNLNETAKKLPCKHLFHEPCISEWLKIHGTCPVCRKNLNGEDTSQREYISRPPVNTEAANQATTSQQTTQTTPVENSTPTTNNQNTETYYEPDFD